MFTIIFDGFSCVLDHYWSQLRQNGIPIVLMVLSNTKGKHGQCKVCGTLCQGNSGRGFFRFVGIAFWFSGTSSVVVFGSGILHCWFIGIVFPPNLFIYIYRSLGPE